jgi:hypothetical protein
VGAHTPSAATPSLQAALAGGAAAAAGAAARPPGACARRGAAGVHSPMAASASEQDSAATAAGLIAWGFGAARPTAPLGGVCGTRGTGRGDGVALRVGAGEAIDDELSRLVASSV